MASEDRSNANVIVDSFTPSTEARLAVPTHPKDPPAAAAPRETGLAGVAAKLTGSQTPKAQPPKPAQSGTRPMSDRRKLTPLKRLERYLSAIFKLGRTEHMAKTAKKRVSHSERRLDDVEGELRNFGRDIHDIWRASEDTGRTIEELNQALDGQGPRGSKLMDDITRTSQRIEQHHVLVDSLVHEFRSERTHLHNTLKSETSLMARVFADLSRRVDAIAGRDGAGEATPAAAPAGIDLPPSEGFEAFKDSFYHRLENRYRGSVDEIGDRLRIYLPDVEAAVMRTGGKPVMDIGCGRGEWLGLLKRAGISGFGVDTNAVQIEAAKEQGLDVRLGDALKALAEQPDNSLALITAHHLVEHLPFDAVAWIAREAQRVLAPGGVLLFETPHTRNVLVGATTFHTDPTHLKPMPEQVLTVLFDTAGFDPVEVRALNPHERFHEFLEAPDFNDELAFLFFGPQDLAVLGTKPGAQD